MGLSEYLVELPIPTTGSILPYVLMAIIGGHNPFLDTPELLYGWLNPIYIHIITILLDPIQIQGEHHKLHGWPSWDLGQGSQAIWDGLEAQAQLGREVLGRNDVEHIIHIYINICTYIYINNISYHYTSYIYICVIVFVNV
jgi:hypothetical protein